MPERLDPAAFIRDEVAPRHRRRIADLRTQIARLDRELEDRLAADATVELVLEGDGGGTWYVTIRGEDVALADRPPAPPVMRVRQTRGDWEALARLGLGGVGGNPAGGELTRSRVDRLRTVRGTLELRLAGDDAERRVTVQFGEPGGDPPPPRCTVAMRQADALRMQKGELTPQGAFMQGIVRLEGDVGFAMQLGAVLFL